VDCFSIQYLYTQNKMYIKFTFYLAPMVKKDFLLIEADCSSIQYLNTQNKIYTLFGCNRKKSY